MEWETHILQMIHSVVMKILFQPKGGSIFPFRCLIFFNLPLTFIKKSVLHTAKPKIPRSAVPGGRAAGPSPVVRLSHPWHATPHKRTLQLLT